MQHLPEPSVNTPPLAEGMVVMLLNLQLQQGGMGYAYVAMRADLAADFLRRHAGTDTAWPDDVVIIFQGEGEYPPEPIRAYIYDAYGFES